MEANRNGIPDMLRAVIRLSLEKLMETDPIAFYEIVTSCRDREHALWVPSTQKLIDAAFISGVNDQGVAVIDSTTREVVVELTEGLDFGF